MLSLYRAVGVGLAVYLASALALAQTAPPASATPAAPAPLPVSAVTPPVARSSTDVAYPQGAEGDAAVVLELIVEKDGSVSQATVVEGEPPFAEPARLAALAWTFSPAQHNGAAVAARIRARVDFRQEAPSEPVPIPVTTPVPRGAAKPPPTLTEPPPPLEITVVGTRREVGQTTLDKDDIRLMPGAFGDAFRAIEALPGVTPLASGFPYYYVRGAPPNTAGYFIDGIRVPILFHLGLAQAVIHPGLIERVDFFPSAAPARYGGVAGGIVAGMTRPAATELHGEANLRLVDAGALVETPFAAGRGNALVAGRYGYPGPVMALITDEVVIDYWDYQARASWKLDSKSTLSIFAFGSHDYLGTRSPSRDPAAAREIDEQLATDFHRVDLRFDRALQEGQLRIALTGGYDSLGAAPSYAKNYSAALRLELEQKLRENLSYRGGIDAHLDHYRLRLLEQNPFDAPAPVAASPPPTNLSAGIHSDVVWRVAPRVELVPGVRFDTFASERRRASPATGRERVIVPAIDARLAARVIITPGVAWLTALGLSHQYPSLRLGNVPASVVSVPGFPFGVRKLQRAAQASQGAELALPGELTLTATGFFNRWWGLTDLSASCYQYVRGFVENPMMGLQVPPYVCPDNDPVRGHAYGLEILLRRPFSKRLSGLLAYTLSRTVQRSRFVTPEGDVDVVTVPSEFDRTHALNAALSYDLGRRWRVGSRLVVYSGSPYSNLDGSIPVPPYRAYRNPAFYRVDFRLEKRWRLGKTGSIAFVVEGQNITLQTEKTNLGQECEGNISPGMGETNTCEPSEFGPLTIPSVGVEAFF